MAQCTSTRQRLSPRRCLGQQAFSAHADGVGAEANIQSGQTLYFSVEGPVVTVEAGTQGGKSVGACVREILSNAETGWANLRAVYVATKLVFCGGVTLFYKHDSNIGGSLTFQDLVKLQAQNKVSIAFSNVIARAKPARRRCCWNSMQSSSGWRTTRVVWCRSSGPGCILPLRRALQLRQSRRPTQMTRPETRKTQTSCWTCCPRYWPTSTATLAQRPLLP
eukprot:m.314263 g.314263  ORF g.314263 m.314263 type:complete len:221 (+) comp23060_c0_seq9:289-951(+)